MGSASSPLNGLPRLLPPSALGPTLHGNGGPISLHSLEPPTQLRKWPKGTCANDSDQNYGQVTGAKDTRKEARSFPCVFGGKGLVSSCGLQTYQLA